MKRLLLVSTVASTLQAFLLPFAEHFRAKGWQVDAVANGVGRSEACLRAFDNVWHVSWTRQPLDPRNLTGPVQRIRRVVEEQHYDIVHAHTLVAALVTRYALRSLRTREKSPKVIYTAHGFHFWEDERGLHNSMFLRLEQLAGRWTDYLVVINREDEAAARKYHIVPTDRVVYMPGIGVDTRKYAPEQVTDRAAAEVREELGLGPEDKLFLMIAEFNPGKRHRDAVAALARFHDNRGAAASESQVHIAFAGEGPLRETTLELAQRLGVSQYSHFLGFRQDIPALIRASVATLLPSEREGLPRSVMESMSLGVPVVGTDIRGIRDLLAGGAGLLVPVNSPADLAQAMAWVTGHPDEARQMGERARRKVAMCDVLRIIAMHEELYARALEDGLPPAPS